MTGVVVPLWQSVVAAQVKLTSSLAKQQKMLVEVMRVGCLF